MIEGLGEQIGSGLRIGRVRITRIVDHLRLSPLQTLLTACRVDDRAEPSTARLYDVLSSIGSGLRIGRVRITLSIVDHLRPSPLQTILTA